jgi:N-hydroxyarylamine O-acetyltransferase
MTQHELDAYLERIGWGGPTMRSYDTLAGILAAHMSAIPWENLDVLLGREIRLDLEGVQAKLVTARRGGYCFEHGTLLQAVLGALGFEPVAHMARVLVTMPRDQTARTHMILSVALPEGRFVLDPGFGALAPRLPVPLVDRQEVTIGHETHWFERDGNEWLLRMRGPDRVADCWVTMLETENAYDFKIANHYTATHPDSSFVNHILMRALLPGGRVALHNRDVTLVQGATTRPSQLADRAALRELVAAHFGFDMPEIDTLKVPTIPEWM